MRCWANFQSVHGLRCCENIARTRNVSECLYSLYAWLFQWHSATGSVATTNLRILEVPQNCSACIAPGDLTVALI